MIVIVVKIDYEVIIGLEIYCQFNIVSKIFCNCFIDFDSFFNINVCLVCLGYLGVLLVFNEEVLVVVVKFGLVINGQIVFYSKFDCKQYFYLDLFKNY